MASFANGLLATLRLADRNQGRRQILTKFGGGSIEHRSPRRTQ